MDNSNILNEHHIWDGHYLQNNQHVSPRNMSENAQATFVPSWLCPSSQNSLVASSSDNLFHPVPGATTSHIFMLPNVPYNPNPHYHAYNRQANTLLRQIPSYSSSYNNPTFSIPPVNLNNPSITPPVVPPRIPSCVRTQPVHDCFQPYYPGYHPLPFPVNTSPPTPALLKASRCLERIAP